MLLSGSKRDAVNADFAEKILIDISAAFGHSFSLMREKIGEKSMTASGEAFTDQAAEACQQCQAVFVCDADVEGIQELYDALALPLRKILVSKIAKVGSGFYGHFEKMGLFVFCKDNLTEADAAKTCRFVLRQQRELEIRYNRLYLADIDELFVCNLDDGLSFDARLLTIPVSQTQRQSFYLQAVRRQLER